LSFLHGIAKQFTTFPRGAPPKQTVFYVIGRNFLVLHKKWRLKNIKIMFINPHLFIRLPDPGSLYKEASI
jgi:hypothetical protein